MIDHRRRRHASAVLVVLLLAGAAIAPAAEVAAATGAGRSETRSVELPAVVRRLLQEQQPDTENLMLAQLLRPRHKGYRWAVTAFKESPSARTNLTIAFAQTAAEGTQSQSSTFGWTLPKRALRMDRDLKPSSLSTGNGMGGHGRISMKLGGKSQFVRARNPEGCTGSIAYRIGSFKGTFRFNARDEYFGKIRFPRSRVLLYRASNLRCDGQPGGRRACPDDLWLSAVDPEAGVAVGAFRTEEGKVDQSVLVVRSSGRTRAAHRISVTVAVPEAFEASDDLTSASVDGDVAGPWLSGDLGYLAPPPATPGEDGGCGAYESSSGIATGDYTAHFDSIGAVTPAATGVPATLRREAP